ncbi:hypothetical protein PRZ48_010149 [Zasmidium cellare]|uniref:Uncharacterized protein n=1 Tax=Zasmidium cellare TaxID=395010 RepID=A0ABR0EEC2_ZASCE|nr:hypothetical protein PRZ48_010149 [Zasmidium cellare]
MQTFATIMSSMLLFSSTGFALPAPNDSADANEATLQRRDNVICYNQGYSRSRETLVTAIDKFCDELDADQALWKNKYRENTFDTVFVSVTPKQCKAIDKPRECKIIMRQPVDGCNTDSANIKQGGTVDTSCATWRVDPNL